MRQLELPEEAAVAVAQHHERWDARGYPQGLAGDAIAVEARIVAAADIAESTIAAEHSSLVARRRFASAIAPYAGHGDGAAHRRGAARGVEVRRVLARAVLARPGGDALGR